MNNIKSEEHAKQKMIAVRMVLFLGMRLPTLQFTIPHKWLHRLDDGDIEYLRGFT